MRAATEARTKDMTRIGEGVSGVAKPFPEDVRVARREVVTSASRPATPDPELRTHCAIVLPVPEDLKNGWAERAGERLLMTVGLSKRVSKAEHERRDTPLFDTTGTIQRRHRQQRPTRNRNTRRDHKGCITLAQPPIPLPLTSYISSLVSPSFSPQVPIHNLEKLGSHKRITGVRIK